MNDDDNFDDNVRSSEKSTCFHFVNKKKSATSDKSDCEKVQQSLTTDCLVNYNSENSGLTNVTLCCAVTEDSKAKGRFQYVGKSKIRVDSYQKLNNLEITMESNNETVSKSRRSSDEQIREDNKSVHAFIRNAVIISGSVSCRKDEENSVEEPCYKTSVSQVQSPKKCKPKIKRAKSTGALYRRPITDHRSDDSDSFDSSLESLIKHNLHNISNTKAMQPVSVSVAKQR